MSELLAPEACPFCGAEPRTDWGFKCGAGPVGGWNSRSVRCREAEVAKLAAERDQLLARVKRLEEAGCNLARIAKPYSIGNSCLVLAIDDWLKAKEAKP